jgi:hypothetical protein
MLLATVVFALLVARCNCGSPLVEKPNNARKWSKLVPTGMTQKTRDGFPLSPKVRAVH